MSSFPKARPGIFLVVALAASGCSDPIQGPGAGGSLHGHFALQPVFAPPAGSISGPAGAAAEDALRRAFERVDAFRLIVRALGSDEVVADETISVQPGQEEYVLSVEVPLSDPRELFRVELRALDGETELFRAGPFEARATPAGEEGPSTPVEAELEYVGPGAEAVAVRVLPGSDITFAGGSVQYAATVLGPQEEILSDVPLGWTIADESVASVSPEGLVTGIAEGTTRVIAETPTGVSGEAVIEVLEALEIIPAESERLPGGTQQFEIVSAPAGLTFAWFVNGIGGGDPTFGTIDAQGFYTAPDAVPDPATFAVCARAVELPGLQGCAEVTVREIPTAGEDVVVFNDVNVFDDTGMEDPNNVLMVRNLVSFTGDGPRSSGTTVQLDLGRDGKCTSGGSSCVPISIFQGTIEEEGHTFETISTSSGTLTSIPDEVKVIFLWTPAVAFTREEINALKAFAAEGGRIVFVGEYEGFYGLDGIAVENAFLQDMGAQMTNVGDAVTAGYTVVSRESLKDHQITEGMSQVTVAAASVVVPGPNDFVLFFDPTITYVLAAVAKIDVTPLPVVLSGGETGIRTEVRSVSETGLAPDPALIAPAARQPLDSTGERPPR